MYKRFSIQALIVVSVSVATVAAVQLASAEPWGTNAPVCPLGRCAPARESWGFYPTKWRRWPGATYPDMSQPMPQPGANQIPPSEIELPSADKEAEVQTPNPARPANGAAGGGPAGGPFGTEPNPGKLPGGNPSNDSLPAPRNAPGAAPVPDEPNFGPPSFGEPPAPTGRSSGISRPRPVFSAQQSLATAVQIKSSDALSKVPPIRASGESALSTTPEAEPDLIIPSLSSRPLHTTSVDVHTDRSVSNPLRDQFRSETVLPASLTDDNPSLGLGDSLARTSQLKSSTASTRENPLRRN